MTATSKRKFFSVDSHVVITSEQIQNTVGKVDAFFFLLPVEEVHNITWAHGSKMYGIE